MSTLAAIAESLPPDATVADLSAELKRRADNEIEPTVSAVTLSTVHNAKGLEWDTVFVIGMSEGLFPLSYSMAEGPIHEERRLAYVAFTRAGRSVTLSWAQRNTASGALRTRSRFIPDYLE